MTEVINTRKTVDLKEVRFRSPVSISLRETVESLNPAKTQHADCSIALMGEFVEIRRKGTEDVVLVPMSNVSWMRR